MRKYLLLLYVFLIITMLFGNYKLSNLIVYFVVALIILGISLKMQLFEGRRKKSYFHFVTLYYIIWLAMQIMKSSITVTKVIWSRKLKISPSTGWINVGLPSEDAQTIFADSITITPGTVTIMATDQAVLVHALWEQDIDILRENDMKKKIERL